LADGLKLSGRTMTTAQLQTKRVTDEEVVAWRLDQLVRAGCERTGAEILARRSHVGTRLPDLLRARDPALADACQRLPLVRQA
jgi:hypothetical protein